MTDQLDRNDVLDAWSGDPADLLDALADLVGRPAWHARAACRGHGPDRWFPDRTADTTVALDLCRRCPVRLPCLTSVWGDTPDVGTWGGTSARQRAAARRRGLTPTQLLAELDALPWEP